MKVYAVVYENLDCEEHAVIGLRATPEGADALYQETMSAEVETRASGVWYQAALEAPLFGGFMELGRTPGDAKARLRRAMVECLNVEEWEVGA